MMNRWIAGLVSFLFFLCVEDTKAQKEQLPVPKEENQLFYLQRDPNSNTVVYSLNLKDGEIDESSPVKTHWIMYEDGGERTGLSFIQRKMAYGVQHEKIAEGKFEIRIQAYKKIPVVVKRNEKSDKYAAFAKIGDKEMVLSRIYVRIDGGSRFNPNVKYIELSGYDPASREKVSHRFTP
jgi:hypothetical protein